MRGTQSGQEKTSDAIARIRSQLSRLKREPSLPEEGSYSKRYLKEILTLAL